MGCFGHSFLASPSCLRPESILTAYLWPPITSPQPWGARCAGYPLLLHRWHSLLSREEWSSAPVENSWREPSQLAGKQESLLKTSLYGKEQEEEEEGKERSLQGHEGTVEGENLHSSSSPTSLFRNNHPKNQEKLIAALKGAALRERSLRLR